MVLVTGATGLVGSHLMIHLLENNERIRALYRNPTAIEKTKTLFRLYEKEFLFENIEWIQADITEVPTLADAFQNIDSVYHCAALISFDPKDEKKLRKTNIEGTANVVNFCLAFKIKKLCFVSSIAALGDVKDFDPNQASNLSQQNTITEATEWNPEIAHSDYAISKYGAEMEIWRGQQEGLRVVIVNPGVILGPGFWKTGSGELFDRVANGLHFYTEGVTGFVSVNDVVSIMISLMKSNVVGERFIVVAETLSFKTALKTVAHSIKAKTPSRNAKPWMTEMYWKLDWLLSLLLPRKRKMSKLMARSLHQTNSFSNEKVTTTLNFKFQKILPYIMEIGRFYTK
jgi:nucleoside-diphosphate-sugar epimerase